MMLLKFGVPGKPESTQVITAPYKGGSQQSKYNTLFKFDGYTDFLLNSRSYQYFVVKDFGGKRYLSSANLGNMKVKIDLEAYQGDEYLEGFRLDSKTKKFTSYRTNFKLNLTDDIQGLWNSGVDSGGPVLNQLYKFEKRIFLIDPEINDGSRFFVITGNLDAPQKVLPNKSPNRLNIQFYTNSTVKKITIGFEVDKFYLNDTITYLRKTFLRPRPASTKPSRRKTLEVFTNCSLTMESNFETLYCYNHFFQGYPRTKDPKDAYLGAVGYSNSFLSGNAGEVFEMVGDRVVNLVVLTAKVKDNGKQKRRGRNVFGIHVPEWDKSKRNSSFISDFSPKDANDFYSPYYITCNFTAPNVTRNCTHYEIRKDQQFDPLTKQVQNKYYLKLLEKYDLNQIPEFTNQHILKVGSAGYLPNIFYITRKFGGERKDIKVLTRFNYSIKVLTMNQKTSRRYRKINHFELPFNLTNDMNFDMCLYSNRLYMFISPSAETPQDKWFSPKIFLYDQMSASLVNRFTGSYSQHYFKEVDMGLFNFNTIRRLQCFDNYFSVIGEDKKTRGMTRLSVFGYYKLYDRQSTKQYINDGPPAFIQPLDPLNLRRFDKVLPNAEPGLEYQIKFIRLTQRNQIVFRRAVFLILKSAFQPWYKDESLLQGNPPDTRAETTLAKNYTDEITLKARALYHQSIYFLKGFIFEDNQPTNIEQTVVSTFGPPELNFTNKANFSYINLIDKVQVFKSKLSSIENKIRLKNQKYNVSNLVQLEGTVISLEVYYNGGQVYNVTSNKDWPQLTDKLFQARTGLPNRNSIMRRFSTIVDFSAAYPQKNKKKFKNRSILPIKTLSTTPSCSPPTSTSKTTRTQSTASPLQSHGTSSTSTQRPSTPVWPTPSSQQWSSTPNTTTIPLRRLRSSSSPRSTSAPKRRPTPATTLSTESSTKKQSEASMSGRRTTPSSPTCSSTQRAGSESESTSTRTQEHLNSPNSSSRPQATSPQPTSCPGQHAITSEGPIDSTSLEGLETRTTSRPSRKSSTTSKKINGRCPSDTSRCCLIRSRRKSTLTNALSWMR